MTERILLNRNLAKELSFNSRRMAGLGLKRVDVAGAKLVEADRAADEVGAVDKMG